MVPGMKQIDLLRVEVHTPEGFPLPGIVRVQEDGVYIGNKSQEIGLSWDVFLQILNAPSIQSRLDLADVQSLGKTRG